MDGEWSDGAAVSSSPTVSGGEGKAGPRGAPADDCPGSPASPAAPSKAAVPAAGGRRRSANKRVVTVPLADVSGPRPKGVGEGNTPTDSWAWRKYGQKPIKGSPFPRAYYRCSSNKGCPARKQVERNRAEPDMVIVTYSFEHNHSDVVPRAQQGRQQAPKPKAQPVPPEPAESLSSGGRRGARRLPVALRRRVRHLVGVALRRRRGGRDAAVRDDDVLRRATRAAPRRVRRRRRAVRRGRRGGGRAVRGARRAARVRHGVPAARRRRAADVGRGEGRAAGGEHSHVVTRVRPADPNKAR